MTTHLAGQAGAGPRPLDPEVVQLRDQQDAQGFPGYMNVGPERAREVSRAVTRWRGLGAEPVDKVWSIKDAQIPTTSALRARIYRPIGNPIGEVLYFHGGGFVVGDLDTCEAHCRALAALVGVVVTSVDYSLAPESPYPVAVHEARDALKWICEQTASRAGRRVPLAVAGDSAGANLASSALALVRGDPDIAVTSQLLLYPMLDPSMSFPSIRENGEGYMMDRATIEWFWRLYLTGSAPEDAMATSPLSSRMEGLPPAIVVTAGYDPFRDEGEEYARRLQAAGVPTTLLSFPSLAHGFFGWGAHVSTARSAISQICTALRDSLLAGAAD